MQFLIFSANNDFRRVAPELPPCNVRGLVWRYQRELSLSKIEPQCTSGRICSHSVAVTADAIQHSLNQSGGGLSSKQSASRNDDTKEDASGLFCSRKPRWKMPENIIFN